MSEKYTSLGLMSGTSGDGVDASMITSDGVNEFETVKDKYFEYDSNIYKDFHFLKDRIFNFHDLKKLSKEINELRYVDGCLIGGASLKVDEFNTIIS